MSIVKNWYKVGEDTSSKENRKASYYNIKKTADGTNTNKKKKLKLKKYGIKMKNVMLCSFKTNKTVYYGESIPCQCPYNCGIRCLVKWNQLNGIYRKWGYVGIYSSDCAVLKLDDRGKINISKGVAKVCH